MKHFQVLLLLVLAVIAVELGLLIDRLPTQVAQGATAAAPPPAPMPAPPPAPMPVPLQGPEFNAHLLQEIGAIRSGQATILRYDQAIWKYENDDHKRLLMTCFMVGQNFLTGPAAAQGPKNRLDFCRAGWWNPQSFNNFDIPFGP